jgi:hypothetical protein
MKMPLVILLFWFSATLVRAEGIIVPGKSGIEAIDTLPTYEWDVPTARNDLIRTLLFGAFLPGGSQFYTQHNVRGGFLAAIELGLAYEVFYNKPLQQDKRFRETHAARDSVAWFTDSLLSHGTYQVAWINGRSRNLSMIRLNNDTKIKEEDLRRSELAWLIGLHVYGIMDGYGIWKHNQGRLTEKRSVKGAVWRAMVVPGLGQFYNGEYGKAGLLYMSFLGGAVSLNTRQGVVDYFKERKVAATLEGAPSTELSQIDEDILFFRKKRNQYVWGIALFYLYSIADAAVDAALSDFDSPLFWALGPSADIRGISAQAGFRF